jgi:hypothetical protein
MAEIFPANPGKAGLRLTASLLSLDPLWILTHSERAPVWGESGALLGGL